MNSPPRKRGVAARPLDRIHGAFTLVETAVAAAVLAVLLAVVLPVLSSGRFLARRDACAGQLRQLSAALAAYADDYGGRFPTRGLPIGDTGRFDIIGWQAGQDLQVPVSNSRNLFLLLAGGHAQPGQLVCPNTDDVPARTSDNGRPLYDFQVEAGPDYRARLSYSYHFQFADDRRPGRFAPLTTVCNPKMPLLADRNPCLRYEDPPWEDGVRATAIEVPAGTPPDRANSLNHDRRGQLVAYADGRVAWAETPAVGPADDNIFTVWNGADRSGGTIDRLSRPQGPTDSFLVP